MYIHIIHIADHTQVLYNSQKNMWLLLVLMHILFIVYFFTVWSRRVWLVPLLVLSLYVINFGQFVDAERFSRKEVQSLALKYALPTAWIAILLWLQGIWSLYFSSVEVRWLLLVGHIVMRLGSYILNYHDGKRIFQLWYIVSLFGIGVTVAPLLTGWTLLHIAMIGVVCTTVLYGAIIFILAPFLEEVLWYREVYGKGEGVAFFLLINLTLLIGIYGYTREYVTVALVLAQLYLMWLYVAIYFVWRYEDHIHERAMQEHDVLQHVLSGKNILWQKKPMTLDLLIDASTFIRSLDNASKAAMSFLNIALITVLMYVFFTPDPNMALWLHEVMFWFSIICFFINYMLLRVLWWYHGVQRVVAFFLVTFGVYVTVLHVFGQEAIYLLLFGVAWSVFNAIMIFHTRFFGLHEFFEPEDYRYWIGATLLATLFNIYFITLLPISGQLMFSLWCLYLGVQGVLSWYNIRYVSKLAVQKEVTYSL